MEVELARVVGFPLRRWTRRYSSQRDEFYLSGFDASALQ